MKHKHRIKPGYEGGKYKEGNVVLLSPTQHAMWHFAEWQRKGNWEDKLAWLHLSRQIHHDEAQKIAILEGSKIGGREVQKVLKDRGRTIYSPGWQSKVATQQVKEGRHPFQRENTTWNRTHSARLANLNRWGWKGLYTPQKEYRTSLSETFTDYYVLFGCP